jgi:hypothetical protein
LIESGVATRSTWVNALRGTAFAGVELEVAFDEVVVAESTPEGAVSTPDEGVYAAEAVVVFEPAETEAEDAYEVEAPAPLDPEEALD